MQIENIKIEKIFPYERNTKIHDLTQINRIANSIKEFWFTQPIVIDKDNIIIIWHWRYEASKKLWLKELPCVRKEWLTKQQVEKLRILDNKLNESERDIDNLNLVLEDLPDFNIWDLEITIDDLFPEPSEKKDFKNKEIEPDDLGEFQHKCPKCGFEFNSDEE